MSLVRLGWLVTIICCVLPFWRGTKVSEEIIIWEGLWDVCEAQGLEILQCVKYSRTTLPQDIQVSRVLVVTCIVITWMGLLLDRYRGDRTCVPNTSTKEKMMVVTSVLFLGLDVLLLVSVSWVTHNVIHGNSLSLLLMETMMGVSLYLGWLSSLLLLLGGAFLGGAHLWYKAPTNNDQHSPPEGSNNDLPSSSEGSRDGSPSENNA